MVDHTFPQNDDPNDAENFGEWGGRQNISDYVEYGLNFQNVDYGNLVFDVTEGKCYTLAPDAAAATTGELRHRIDYGIHLDARGGKTLTDNAVNYVFVKPNVATDDAPEIVVNTTGTPPTDASLKIGELDTNNNTATELNRRPDVTLGDADIERLAAALDANGQDISNVGAFDSDSVSTVENSITGETDVKLSRSSSLTSVSAGSYVNAFDTVDEDNRNEVNSSTEFVPDKSGRYEILAMVRMVPGSSGDNLRVRLQNVTDSTTIEPRFFDQASASAFQTVFLSFSFVLTSGKAYEIQVTDNNSSFDVDNADTAVSIRWSPVQ
ncbi:hypothetical protein [Haloarcula onubensis]|uniref:CBM6 domain-containing protein n=1 Tax=Haloarcula onubensis TaxID=2950539 RepID=A0ABU2FV85_9EURY|nr:hypothetical protein [Halomicroarcula sp. S3CR25-11]MDS0284685.1 hypothetical protein [Halomicroarcula sp. S3CR25-11]